MASSSFLLKFLQKMSLGGVAQIIQHLPDSRALLSVRQHAGLPGNPPPKVVSPPQEAQGAPGTFGATPAPGTAQHAKHTPRRTRLQGDV